MLKLVLGVFVLFLSFQSKYIFTEAKCQFPFIYNGSAYFNCTTAGKNVSWCSVQYVYQGHWQLCDNNAFEDSEACSFPFVYRGKTYNKCTTDYYTMNWCSLDYDYKGRWKICPVPKESFDVETVMKIWPVYNSVNLIFGLLANSFCCYYFIVTDTLTDFTRRLLLSLSICDLMVNIFSQLDPFLNYVFGLFIMSSNQAICKIIAFISNMAICGSVFFLEMLALERLIGVVIPKRLSTFCSFKAVTIIFTLVLIYAVLSGGIAAWRLHSIIFNCVYYYNDPVLPFIRGNKAFFHWQQSIVLIVADIAILMKLKKLHSEQALISRKTQRTVRTLLGLSFISLLVTTPYLLFNVIMEYDEAYILISQRSYGAIFSLLATIYYSNHSLNILFYMISTTDFRKRLFTRVFCCPDNTPRQLEEEPATQCNEEELNYEPRDEEIEEPI